MRLQTIVLVVVLLYAVVSTSLLLNLLAQRNTRYPAKKECPPERECPRCPREECPRCPHCPEREPCPRCPACGSENTPPPDPEATASTKKWREMVSRPKEEHSPWFWSHTVHQPEQWVSENSPSGWPRCWKDRHNQQLNYFSWAAAKHSTEVPLAHFLKVVQYVSGMWDEMHATKETHLYTLYNSEPKVIVDVGANVGFFSAEAILAFQPPCEKWRGSLKWSAKLEENFKKNKWKPFVLGHEHGHSSLVLHAFEPKKENWEILNSTLSTFCHPAGCNEKMPAETDKLNFGQRRLGLPPALQVVAHHKALSEKPGRAKLYHYAKNGKTNNFGGDELPSLVNDGNSDHQDFEMVDVDTVDSWWAKTEAQMLADQKEKLAASHEADASVKQARKTMPQWRPRPPAIFILKIDAEKHELEVLSGATDVLKRRMAGIVMWECSNANATKNIVNLMERNGYWSYLLGLRSLVILNGKVWTKVFDRGLWANCVSIASDHYLLPSLESAYSLDMIVNIPKKYFWNV